MDQSVDFITIYGMFTVTLAIKKTLPSLDMDTVSARQSSSWLSCGSARLSWPALVGVVESQVQAHDVDNVAEWAAGNRRSAVDNAGGGRAHQTQIFRASPF